MKNYTNSDGIVADITDDSPDNNYLSKRQIEVQK